MFRILLIEDDMLLLEALARLFRREGYEVDTAYNGNVGMQKVRDNRYDLVLTDLIMPYSEGFEIVRHIRLYQKNSAARVVIYTSLDNEAAESAGYNSGADLFIAKPMPAKELMAKIRSVLPPQA